MSHVFYLNAALKSFLNCLQLTVEPWIEFSIELQVSSMHFVLESIVKFSGFAALFNKSTPSLRVL